MNVTDNEIIKAWEKILATGDAPVGEHWSFGGIVTTKLVKDTLELIERKDADIKGCENIIDNMADRLMQKDVEIEKLTVQNNAYRLGMKIEAEKAEKAQTEIERLKSERDILLKECKKCGRKTQRKISKLKKQNLELLDMCAEQGEKAIKEFSDKYEKAVLPLLTSATLDMKDGIYACLDILKEIVSDDND